MTRRGEMFRGLLLVAIPTILLFPACKKESSNSGNVTKTSTPAAKLVARADVETCLTQAGLQIDTGSDMPKLSGVVGVGVRSAAGGGKLLPRDQEAAVFVYPSEEAAKSEQSSAEGFRFPEVRLGGNVLVIFAPKPSQEFLAQVGRCSFELAPT